MPVAIRSEGVVLARSGSPLGLPGRNDVTGVLQPVQQRVQRPLTDLQEAPASPLEQPQQLIAIAPAGTEDGKDRQFSSAPGKLAAEQAKSGDPGCLSVAGGLLSLVRGLLRHGIIIEPDTLLDKVTGSARNLRLGPFLPTRPWRRADACGRERGDDVEQAEREEPADDIPPGDQLPVFSFLSRLWQYRDGLTYLSPAPLYHSAPQAAVNLAIRHGGTVIIMEKFDPEQYLRLVERYRVTHSQLVPTMFSRMLKLPEQVRSRHDLSSLETAVHAAAPCPVPVKQQMIQWWGPVLLEYYASTEAVGFSACDSAEWLAHPGTGFHHRGT